MRKLICDCCGEEIDTTYFDEYSIHPKARLRVYNEVLSDLEYDLCINCSSKVVDLIKMRLRLQPEV